MYIGKDHLKCEKLNLVRFMFLTDSSSKCESILPVAVFFSTVLSDTIKLWRHYPQCDLLPPVEVAETRVVKF